MYQTVEEAQQKLMNTLVMYGDAPAYVMTARNSTKLGVRGIVIQAHSTPVINGEAEKITAPINDPKWNFRDLGAKIGYVNYRQNSRKEVVYLMRQGIRKAVETQGLSRHNMVIQEPSRKTSGASSGWSVNPIRFQDLVFTRELADMMMNVYPSIKKTVKDFETDPELSSQAFGRCFSIHRDKIGPFYLHYRDRPIGYTSDMYRWKVAKDYHYLAESLEEYSDDIKVA